MARQAKTSRGAKRTPKQTAKLSSAPHAGEQTQPKKRLSKYGLSVVALLVLGTAIFLSVRSREPITGRSTETDSVELVEVDFQGDRSTWQLLALSDEELEKVSLVELNLAVVREIPGYEDLDIAKYEKIVDEWTREFAKELPVIEATFHGREDQFNDDLRFYRVGQLMAWLGHKKNIEYIPEQRDLDAILYTDPGELFLHGLLDTTQGTCGNMPTLQAAIARRLGWPVSLAPIESHTVCRFDDGEVIYNIETTHTDKGGFSSGTEEDYINEFNLPPCALTEGDTLETMTAREMLAYFISLRARYYHDTGDWEKADQDYALARSVLPRHRKLLLASIETAVYRSNQIFQAGEQQHPYAIFARVGQMHEDRQRQDELRLMEQHRAQMLDIDRINEENRRRMEQQFQTPPPAQSDPFGNQAGFPNDPHNPFP